MFLKHRTKSDRTITESFICSKHDGFLANYYEICGDWK